MTLDHAGIERCVSHAGSMVLLNAVLHWDATHIVCSAAAPDAGHPLARDGAVRAVTAAEYAAQAIAVHGALLEHQAAPRLAMLAKLSNVELHSACIPTDRGPLAVRAELLSRAAAGCLYDFEVACARQPVATGRLLVAFAAPPGR